MTVSPARGRAGLVAIVGAPNAGKSTLINALAGRKVAIVTHKAQTTRFPVRAEFERDGARVALADTPGLFEARDPLERAMRAAIHDTLDEADAVIHLRDVAAPSRGTGRRALSGTGTRPVVLVMNKTDRLRDKKRLLPMAEAWAAERAYDSVLMISARTRDGIEALARRLARLMPNTPRAGAAAAAPRGEQEERVCFAAEIVREHLMRRLHRELPYRLAVVPGRYEESADGAMRIAQTVLVAEERHLRIAVGAGGRVLAAVGRAARTELARLWGRTVHLSLRVEVARRPGDPALAHRRFGLKVRGADG